MEKQGLVAVINTTDVFPGLQHEPTVLCCGLEGRASWICGMMYSDGRGHGNTNKNGLLAISL